MRFTGITTLFRNQLPRGPRARRRVALLSAAVALLAPALAAQQPQSTPPAPAIAQTTPQPGNAPVPALSTLKSPPPAVQATEPKPNLPIADQSANLLKMANDLMAEVSKSTKDTLSVSVIRKADEIEHYARDVRLKAGNDVGAN